VESIAYGRPIVTFPHGVDGIREPLLDFCHVASDWHEFAVKIITLLGQAGDGQLEAKRQLIKSQLAPATVYAELDRWLSGLDQAAAA